MKRTNSWKNLQQTFASTPILSVKRAKVNRTNLDSSKSSIDENHSFQIEDSDEENVPCIKLRRTPLKTPIKTQSKPKPIKSIPLLINTSINATKTNDSFVCNSDSGESVDGEPELRDVSMLPRNARHSKKARSKSLLFLTKDEQNQSNSRCDKRTTLKDITPTKQQQSKSNHKNGFNKTLVNRRHRLRRDNNDETIIESDSLDGTELPTKQSQNITECAMVKQQHSDDILFTQSRSSASNPVIESTSSQFSLSLKSQQPAPNKRNKPKKHVKGGLVERLHKILNGIKSDFSFWMNERTSDLIEPGEKMRIDTIEQSYGRVLLHCSSNNDQPSDRHILCIDPSYKKLTMLQIGKTIEVCFDTNGYRNANGSIFHPNVTKILISN